MIHPTVPAPSVVQTRIRVGVALFLLLVGVIGPMVLLGMCWSTTNAAWYQLEASKADTVRALLISQVALTTLGVGLGAAAVSAALRLLEQSDLPLLQIPNETPAPRHESQASLVVASSQVPVEE